MTVPGISSYARDYVRSRTSLRMIDACRIWHPGDVVLDKATGKSSRADGTTKYEGPCRFWEVPTGSPTVSGQQELVTATAYLSLPWDAGVPESDDIIEITDCDDTDLVGRTVTIVSMIRGGGLRASRVFQVQVVTSQKASW